MTNQDIEKIGTSAVRLALIKSKYLEPYIPDDNTVPSWDGTVYIYNKQTKTKKNFLGKVDVQVKGTEQNDFSLTQIKYDASVDDLKAYASDGGTIFFVVYVNSECQTKIYYNTLTPVKLYELLKNCDNQEDKRITLDELPNENREVANIFFHFYDCCRKQRGFTPDKMIPFAELLNNNEITHITGFATGINFADGVSAFLNSEPYLYVQKNNLPINIPVLAGSLEVSVNEVVPANITVKGIQYYDHITVKRTKHTQTVYIGKSLFYCPTLPPIKIKWEFIHNLNDLLIDLEFMIQAVENGGYEINGCVAELSFTDTELQALKVDQAKSTLPLIKNIKKVFDLLHIKKDINLSKLAKEEWRTLFVLVEGILNNQPIAGWKQDLAIHGVVKIQNISISLGFEKVAGKEHTYKIYDFFHMPIMIAIGGDSNKFAAPPYALLTPQDYGIIDNIDYEDIVTAYDALYTTIGSNEIFDSAITNMLRLIDAYDMLNHPILLKTALDLCDWIMAHGDDGVNMQLNKMQIIKRERKFTKEEKQMLLKIAEDNSQYEEARIGAYLLLDNHFAVQTHLEKLSKKAQEAFMSYPIYTKFGKMDI